MHGAIKPRRIAQGIRADPKVSHDSAAWSGRDGSFSEDRKIGGRAEVYRHEGGLETAGHYGDRSRCEY